MVSNFFSRYKQKMSLALPINTEKARQDALIMSTSRLSLCCQVVFLFVSLAGFAVPSKAWNLDFLLSLLILEETSQIIEFTYYFLVAYWFRKPLETYTRYFDWFLSTPVMLLSASGFLYYESMRVFTSEDPGVVLSLGTLITEKWNTSLLVIFVFNATMLAIGFGIEIKQLPLAYAIPGMILLVGYYTILYLDNRRTTSLSLAVWLYMLCIWGLYGVAITQS